jgi:hypothetical protein
MPRLVFLGEGHVAMEDAEVLQQQHAALGRKLDKFEGKNSEDHNVIHSRMDNIFKWLLGLLVSIILTTMITIWQVSQAASERRAQDIAIFTETDTTQTAVLSRLTSVEEEVDEVNEHSEQRMSNHNSNRHKDGP